MNHTQVRFDITYLQTATITALKRVVVLDSLAFDIDTRQTPVRLADMDWRENAVELMHRDLMVNEAQKIIRNK
jgi:hypothetical protein